MKPASWLEQADPAARWLADGLVFHLKRWAAKPETTTSVLDRALACAHHLSLATSAGHVCLSLDEPCLATDRSAVGSALRPIDQAQQLAQDLIASGLAVREGSETSAPMVIDTHHRLYLARYFELELRLTRRIMKAAVQPRTKADPKIVQTLATLFDTLAEDTVNAQFAAARMALTHGLSIISGGPGTGKTTTVVNLLAGLLMQDSTLRIALAAPTGKAAARMLDAISARAAALPPQIREKLPGQASTIHRLIGIHPRAGLPRHHAGAPLPIDALVIDEASMLDLAMATQLLEAVPDNARIILLGDKDQLAAVEAGAVFAELSSLRESLPSCIVWFTRNFRFAENSSIGRLAQAVRAGESAQAQQCLSAHPATLERIEPAHEHLIQERIEAGFQGYCDKLEEVLRRSGPHTTPASQQETAAPDTAASVNALHDALLSFRVLCALRQGPHGVEHLNTRIGSWLQRSVPGSPRSFDPDGWHPGRAIMITRNDPASGLFNGDIGIALPDAGGALRVCFPSSPEAAEGAGTQSKPAFRSLPIERLPEHETAFALTVHKSQGSEFNEVLLILAPADSPILGRELLYTGITRARNKVAIVGSEQALQAAIEQPTRRFSGLADRIRGSLTGTDGCQ